MQPKRTGTNIILGDCCSTTAYEWARKTFTNRRDRFGMPLGHLGASFSQIVEYGSVQLAISSDGIGTKVELAERMEKYDTLGFDLIAMVADDLICNGSEPTNFSNILDVDYLDNEIVNQLMRGLHDAAKEASIAVTGGEIAELGSRISGYGPKMHFNWCGTGIGVLTHSASPLDGSQIKQGDMLIALRSRGFRSNGFTLARRILEQRYHDTWHLQECTPSSTWGHVLLSPSLIYAPGVINLFSLGDSIKSIVHITGGGIAGNLERVLKHNGYGAILSDLYPPFLSMKTLQKYGNVSERDAYDNWNMGQGMLLIIAESAVREALNILKNHGYEAKTAGIISSDDTITLHSRGENPEVLTYTIRRKKECCEKQTASFSHQSQVPRNALPQGRRGTG